MSGSITIEEVRDLERVWAELKQLFLELHEYHQPWLARQLRPDWEQRWHDYVTIGDDRLILLAQQDGKAVAYLNASIRRDYGLFTETVGFIDDAYVQAGLRRLGLGSEMLARAEGWFRERGVEDVRLNVV